MRRTLISDALQGGYFGWLYLVTGNLVVPMVAHLMVDLVSFFINYVRIAWLSDAEAQREIWNTDAPIAKSFRDGMSQPVLPP